MSKRLTTEEFIKKSIKKHGNKYDYSKVEYVNTKTKVYIICPEHGEFWQSPDHHLQGHGCPKCSGLVTNTKEFIEKAKSVHGNKYDYSKVKYVNCHTKVCIICPEHGEFWQNPSDHINGSGCPKCKAEKIGNINRKGKYSFIEEAKNVHGDKYDYSKVEYTNNKAKVCIICHEHGEFWQVPCDHLKGCGCPKCGHILTRQKITKYDSYEYIKECASKCTHRAVFQKKYPQACKWARKRRLMNELFPINRRDKEAKIHFVYRFMFTTTNSVYIGRTVEPIKREKAHNKMGPVYLHSIDNNIDIPKMDILYNKLTLDESRIKEDEMVKLYKSQGYNILNKAKTGINSGAIGSIGFGKLTREYCFNKAKECKSKSELENKYSSVYLKALKNKWLDDYTWFVEIIKPKGYWDVFENVEREAKKYKTKNEFYKGCRSAYNAARRNNWLNKLFPKQP